MFHKDGSVTQGGKKDTPLRKSDRRQLRDRVVKALFIGDSNEDTEREEWIERAVKLIDDAIIASKGGNVLSRKLKLSGGGYATMYLRTPNDCHVDVSSCSTAELRKCYPITWPYHQSTQAILLEYEDSHHKIHFVPLLALLSAIPPPLNQHQESAEEMTNPDCKRYRIPNITIFPQVSKYICRGAELMKSGIQSFPPPWEIRQSAGIVTISIIGNPQPMAVGIIENELFREYCYSKVKPSIHENWRLHSNSIVGPGKKGVAVMVVNCYGDDIWKSCFPTKTEASSTTLTTLNPLGGRAYDDGHYGNMGFENGKIVSPISHIKEKDSVVGDEGQVDIIETVHEDENASQSLIQLELSDMISTMTVIESGAQHITNDIANVHHSVDSKNDTYPAEIPDESDGKFLQLEQDKILLTAFYTSLLQILVSKIPLPIPVATYFGKHLISAVPSSGPRLDLKKTSYKKIGPFLLDMESHGVIKLGASMDGKDRCAFLIGIEKKNQELIDFKTQWKKEVELNGGEKMVDFNISHLSRTLSVVDLFLIPDYISHGLQFDKDDVMAKNAKSDERKGTGLLTKAECVALIENYIEKEDLVDANDRRRIHMNGPLCDALYRPSKNSKQSDTAESYPTSVIRKDLIQRWMEHMEIGHALVEMPGSRILRLRKGEPQLVEIEVEFRQGNRKKFLTHLRGMEEYGIEAQYLSHDVSLRFGCSSTIETNPIGRPALKKGRSELLFQGHLSEQLTALLTGDEKLTSHGGVKGAKYNLPKRIIKVTLKKGVPSGKRNS